MLQIMFPYTISPIDITCDNDTPSDKTLTESDSCQILK